MIRTLLAEIAQINTWQLLSSYISRNTNLYGVRTEIGFTNDGQVTLYKYCTLTKHSAPAILKSTPFSIRGPAVQYSEGCAKGLFLKPSIPLKLQGVIAIDSQIMVKCRYALTKHDAGAPACLKSTVHPLSRSVRGLAVRRTLCQRLVAVAKQSAEA